MCSAGPKIDTMGLQSAAAQSYGRHGFLSVSLLGTLILRLVAVDRSSRGSQHRPVAVAVRCVRRCGMRVSDHRPCGASLAGTRERSFRPEERRGPYESKEVPPMADPSVGSRTDPGRASTVLASAGGLTSNRVKA